MTEARGATPSGSGSLAGCRVLVTRPREQAADLAREIVARGGEVVTFAALKVVPPPDWAPLDRALETAASGYDWAVFTSANGVRAFVDRLRGRGRDVGDWRGVRVAAIGPVTAATLRDAGLQVDVVPREYRAEALLEAMAAADDLAGKRIALIRALEAREVLPDGLRERGARVEVIPAYQTVMDGEGADRVAGLLDAGQLDVITFASPSAVRHLCAAIPEAPARARRAGVLVACIGPITAEAVAAAGFLVHVTAKQYTAAGLAEALAEAWSRRRGGGPS